MDRITQLTNDVKQGMFILLPSGEKVELHIEYKSLEQGWFITTMIYNDFTLRGIRMVTSGNMLYQFKNQIPFGFAIAVDGDQDPLLQNDFASGRARFYLMDETDKAAFEALLVG